MKLTKLTLKNFRNHDFITFDFTSGVNSIEGENATGKTNIVEAIYYLSLARSFRGVDDLELIKNDSNFASEIYAVIEEGTLIKKIRITITKKGRTVLLNGKNVSKLSELTKCVNVVLFEPKDAMLFKGLPKERRNFIDINLSKKSSAYFDLLSKYEKVLNKRNNLLKSEKVDENLLQVLTEMLVKLAGPIVSYREMYVKDINDILNKITRTLAGENYKLEIVYKPFVPNTKEFESNALAAYKGALSSDIKHHATSLGVHREDFSMLLNDKDIATYGSQGENRLAALALKLTPYFLIEEKEKKPIVILDDVLSELDNVHQVRLLKFLKKFEQVFITGTKLGIDGNSRYEIKK